MAEPKLFEGDTGDLDPELRDFLRARGVHFEAAQDEPARPTGEAERGTPATIKLRLEEAVVTARRGSRADLSPDAIADAALTMARALAQRDIFDAFRAERDKALILELTPGEATRQVAEAQRERIDGSAASDERKKADRDLVHLLELAYLEQDLPLSRLEHRVTPSSERPWE